MDGQDGGAPSSPPRPSAGRPRRWAAIGLLLALLGLVAVLGVLLGTDGQRDAGPSPRVTPLAGSLVPESEIAGTWSGEGSLARCAGFDEGCPGVRSVTLTVDCSRHPCAVTPFDSRFGAPPLDVQDGRYRAAGPLPAEVAPTCDGVPTSSALWRVELSVRDGRLVGSYAESTVQGFECGATGVAWDVVLDHR
ncbi:hypothetical protein [Modestobacter excelsi]|uniref:hypothetical protein n=1 Tax=Modestobacter excelsi TaxID=2213161 RepID=UPI00110CDC2B|nr:hypothetical protein [Modestobacter excelsi]